MFPTQTTTNVTTTSTNGTSFNFDFTAGDFVIVDGKVQTLTGLEALKVWITKALKTQKFKFKIYNSENSTEEYGISLLELVNSGYPYSFIVSEIEREITNVLLTNSEIETVTNFSFSRDVKRTLTVSFTVYSIYGTTESEVTI